MVCVCVLMCAHLCALGLEGVCVCLCFKGTEFIHLRWTSLQAPSLVPQ